MVNRAQEEEPEVDQDDVDLRLYMKLNTLSPDGREHLLKLLEQGTILDCGRRSEG